MTDNRTLDRLAELAAGDPARRAIAAQEIARAGCLRDHVTPGDLAVALDPTNRQVGWLRKLELGLVWVAETDGARLLVSAPSQGGKSQRVIWFAVWCLVLDPDRRIVIFTHSEELARAHSERIRAIISQYGTGAKDAQTGSLLPDRLGIGLGDKTAAGRWTLAGRRGGVTALAVKSALPGISADLLILDDLHSGAESAESRTGQRKLRTVWETAIRQRLSPGGRVVSIGTRFGVGDIQTYLLGQKAWQRLNFPAIAEPGLLDSLKREPGTPLDSARGVRDWEAIKSTTPS
ncbi:hypothetical protein [Lolliginicoccus suaedae]|uniref:hypothetical protein n=1 Tax=Lolliginicoccus suaedae TaxID=2605429 RepID=UPI0011EFE1B9|nr:hypothetical protein [Lolliginicoccus suaedae]